MCRDRHILIYNNSYFCSMKPIALILVILVLLLSATPCAAVASNGQHQKEQCDDNDGDCKCCCSPFFCCGTCTGFAIDLFFSSNIVTVNSENYVAEVSSMCNDQIHSSFFGDIWQPPPTRLMIQHTTRKPLVGSLTLSKFQ